MPYKDRAKQREYQRQWIAKRRNEFFSDKVCFVCGSGENLQLHHIDKTKKETHRIWSWSAERREAEIKGCVVVCSSCHAQLHALDRVKNLPDEYGRYFCIKCGQWKPPEEMRKDRGRRSGLTSQCKKCRSRTERERCKRIV